MVTHTNTRSIQLVQLFAKFWNENVRFECSALREREMHNKNKRKINKRGIQTDK